MAALKIIEACKNAGTRTHAPSSTGIASKGPGSACGRKRVSPHDHIMFTKIFYCGVNIIPGLKTGVRPKRSAEGTIAGKIKCYCLANMFRVQYGF